MWWRSVRDDKSSSRGRSGSCSDQDGLGIPSRSAPASTRDVLTAKVKDLLRELRAGGDRVGDGLLVNLALGQVERAGRRWRAEDPKRRFSPLALGRPALLERDVEILLALRAANPGADCRAEFAQAIGARKQRARIRDRDADKRIAEMTSRSVE